MKLRMHKKLFHVFTYSTLILLVLWLIPYHSWSSRHARTFEKQPMNDSMVIRQLWQRHVHDAFGLYPNFTRSGMLETLTLGAPWTMAVQITNKTEFWLPPLPVLSDSLPEGQKDTFRVYAAGTMVLLKLMARLFEDLPNSTLMFFYDDNCLYGWRSKAISSTTVSTANLSSAPTAWLNWVGQQDQAAMPVTLTPLRLFPPLTYQVSKWRPTSLECYAIAFPQFDWVWPGQDMTEASQSRMDGLASNPWASRKPVAVFRGTQKADSIPFNDNARRSVRVRAVTAALQNPGILDVKLYSHCRPPEPRNCNNKDLNDSLFADYMNIEDQLKYKYQLDIDGHGGTFRLKHLMLSGSLVLKIDSPLSQHWMADLVPWFHFVPVSWHDLEVDLPRKVQWAISNDALAEQIMMNGRQYALEAFKDSNTAWYMREVIKEIAKRQPGKFDLVPGSTRFCCKLLSETANLKHFYEKCQMYDDDPLCDSGNAKTLRDIYQ